MSEPTTPTGRKLVAIHGAAFLDDVLGIESEAEYASPEPDGRLQVAMDALKAALLWLDGEYVDRPRAEFNREVWGERAREGIRALVHPANAEMRAYAQGHSDGVGCGIESCGFGYTGCEHVGRLSQ